MKKWFHYISYLQYPLMLIGVYFLIVTYLTSTTSNKEFLDVLFTNYNTALIFMGLGISFSTLQDTTKTQNNFSKKVWENPKKGKITIIAITIITFLFIVLGIIGYFSTVDSRLQDLSIGILVFSAGLIGLLKSAMEMFENHRTDKK